MRDLLLILVCSSALLSPPDAHSEEHAFGAKAPIRFLHEAVVEEGCCKVTVRDGSLFFHRTGLTVVARELPTGPGMASYLYRVLPTKHFTDPIDIHAIGFGSTEEAASRSSAEQWLRGVYPVLSRAVTGQRSLGVVRQLYTVFGQPESDAASDLKARLEPVARRVVPPEAASDSSVDFLPTPGEAGAWKVHLGPFIRRAFSPGGPPDPLSNALAGAVLEPASEFGARVRMWFWIEAFVAKVPDGGVTADVRLLSEPWPSAEAALLRLAQDWEKPGSVRQFLLFEPVAMYSVPETERKMLLQEYRLRIADTGEE